MCSLPHRRVHEIKRTYLASRTHGLFITKTQSFISTIYTRRCMPQPPFDNPLLLLGNPSPYSLELSPYLLGNPSFVSWHESPSTPVPGWLYTNPPPFLPIPFPPPHDIAISASYSPIHHVSGYAPIWGVGGGGWLCSQVTHPNAVYFKHGVVLCCQIGHVTIISLCSLEGNSTRMSYFTTWGYMSAYR
jgi:hypothetical protein